MCGIVVLYILLVFMHGLLCHCLLPVFGCVLCVFYAFLDSSAAPYHFTEESRERLWNSETDWEWKLWRISQVNGFMSLRTSLQGNESLSSLSLSFSLSLSTSIPPFTYIYQFVNTVKPKFLCLRLWPIKYLSTGKTGQDKSDVCTEDYRNWARYLSLIILQLYAMCFHLLRLFVCICSVSSRHSGKGGQSRVLGMWEGYFSFDQCIFSNLKGALRIQGGKMPLPTPLKWNPDLLDKLTI